MEKIDLYEDKNFVKLCDIVSKNNLICLTGSGISKGLQLKKYDNAPDWKELLLNIKNNISCEEQFSEDEESDLNELLSKDAVGDQLIEAASILHAKNKDLFNKTLVDSIDLIEGQTSLTHKALLRLSPRGIITFNYDIAHENSFKSYHVSDQWTPILPHESDKIIDIIKSNAKSKFLFKAHGSVTDHETMVLTGTSYRELFNKYPYYKAFMQHVFTNFNLLIVGFGLSDPDFDILLQNIFSIFGSPIQEHIVIKHINDKSPKDTFFKRRYGLNFIYVEDFDDIPKILEESTIHPGSNINEILKKCISDNRLERISAHDDVRELSEIGKRCLSKILKNKIKENISNEKNKDYSFNTENSEYVYTLGIIGKTIKDKKLKEDIKDFFIYEIVNKSAFSETIAHAFVHLRDILDTEDIYVVEQWLTEFKNKKFIEDTENPDPDNRVYSYCLAILHLLKAKERS